MASSRGPGRTTPRGGGALLVLFVLNAGVAGAQVTSVSTRPDSGARIEVQPTLPAASGYAPLRVKIRNDSDRDHSWTFLFQSYGTSGMRRETTSTLEVPAGEERRYDLVVPFATGPFERSYLSMQVHGYGVENAGWNFPMTAYYGSGAAREPALSESLRAGEAAAQPRPQPVVGDAPADAPETVSLSFDPRLLPSDWRGLTAFPLIALWESEWRGLDPEARTALQDWCLHGGRLVRVGAGTTATSDEAYGLGSVALVPTPSTAEEWSRISEVPAEERGIDYPTWAGRMVLPIETRKGLLLVYLLTYALLVGPVNLFVFCRRGKRSRLFWTMPALALAASAFLTVVIVLQDGLGGTGHRVALVRLAPDLAREVVLQEQVSRTGALLERGFEMDESIALFDVRPETYGYGGSLTSAASVFDGGWFRSRAVQIQRLDAVRPSRARIEWTGEGSLLSSIGDPIEELFYRDDEGRLWRARDVAPGRAIALAPATEPDYEAFWKSVSATAGPQVRARLRRLSSERDAFVGRTRHRTDAVIGTLDAIDWQDTVIYSGRPVRR
jgi:hypothetical protein